MPLNQIKTYNQLLDIVGMSELQRTNSLKSIFRRDFEERQPITFNNKIIYPAPRSDGEIPMTTLFRHLTTEMINEQTRERAFELDRSLRLHWVRYHLDQRKTNNMLVFSTIEKGRNRTYCYDKDEQYVIVLEPLRDGKSYYLLTAYYIKGKDRKRNKIERKYERHLPQLL